MTNSNEKMRVLDLLESGKISAPEAAELLSVLNSRSEGKSDSEEKLRQFAKDCNQFAREVGCKMQEMYKDVEPKVKKASKSALEKAAAALDNLASSINESLEKADDEDDEPKEN
jgi:MinD-like ATPase involved in chromosome partitioning or flagellar assembly